MVQRPTARSSAVLAAYPASERANSAYPRVEAPEHCICDGCITDFGLTAPGPNGIAQAQAETVAKGADLPGKIQGLRTVSNVLRHTATLQKCSGFCTELKNPQELHTLMCLPSLWMGSRRGLSPRELRPILFYSTEEAVRSISSAECNWKDPRPLSLVTGWSSQESAI